MAYGKDTVILLDLVERSKTTKTLFLEELVLTHLPELPDDLEVLSFNETTLEILPKLPKSLTHLYIEYCDIETLPELHENMKHLSVQGTTINELPMLPSRLEFLDCSNCEFLTELPELPKTLTQLRYGGTPLKTVPEKAPGTWPMLVLKYNITDIDPCDYNAMISRFKLKVSEWNREEDARKRVQTRCKAIKEELMMEAWKPTRVQKWIDSVGFSILE